MHRENITVTVLDTVTGETATDDRWTEYWWAEGNGSCDCNRDLLFDNDTEDTGHCMGNHRYLIVASESKSHNLLELNRNYPEELIEKYAPHVLTQPD